MSDGIIYECEYCAKRATHQRYLEGDGGYLYCDDHAPADAERIRPKDGPWVLTEDAAEITAERAKS